MVKCSYIVAFAVLAVAASFENAVRAETTGSGSALNDTGSSAAADTATVSLSSLGSGSASSATTDNAGATTATSSLADAGSASVASVGSTSASAAAETVTTPAATTATPTNSTTPTSTQAPKPTPTPTPTPTRTVKSGPQPIAGQVRLVPGYQDCGGVGFNYTVYMPEDPATSDMTRLTCEAGYRCLDADGSDTYTCDVWPSREPVAFYGQCGGGNYDGQTFCAPGAVCKYISPSFSQCLPTY